MVGDDVEAARLQGAKGRLVHLRAVDVQEAEVVIVEHQRHEIEFALRQFGRERIFERPRQRGDRRGRDAGALELVAAFGERDRRRAGCGGRGGRGGRRGRGRRNGRMAVAFGRCGAGRGLVGIAGPALPIDGAVGPDAPRQQFGRVAAAGTEIEGGDAGANADEDQHLLGLAAAVVGAVGVAALRARHDLRGLLGRDGLRLRDAGAEHDGAKSQEGSDSDLHGLVLHSA